MSSVYDAGALLAIERGDREMWTLLKVAMVAQRPPVTHAAVIGQVWRAGPRQAGLASALAGIEVHPIDEALGRRAGELLAATATSDVVDAALALLTHEGAVVFTSDPDDLAHLLATLGRDVEIVRV